MIRAEYKEIIIKLNKKVNMKTNVRNFLKSALIIAVVMCCFSCNKSERQYIKNKFITVEKGQLWIFEAGSENPFIEHTIDTFFVLDVKNKYVLYKQNGRGDQKYSERERTFKAGSRLLK
jgi:hypothetical protein